MLLTLSFVPMYLPGARELFAQPHPSMVRMVNLPTLETVDRPCKADELLLKQQLAEMLEASMHDMLNGVGLAQAYIRRITGPFTWEAIFTRIEVVYKRALEGR